MLKGERYVAWWAAERASSAALVLVIYLLYLWDILLSSGEIFGK
jgi:hypothetical protein